MSRREDIDNAVWGDEDWIGLSPEAKLLYRDETTVERFMGYADEATEARASEVEKARKRAVSQRGEHFSKPGEPRWFSGTLELILHALEQHGCTVRWSAHQGRGSAQCPAHDDRDPSLSLKECDDSKVLIHCFAGCDTERRTWSRATV